MTKQQKIAPRESDNRTSANSELDTSLWEAKEQNPGRTSAHSGASVLPKEFRVLFPPTSFEIARDRRRVVLLPGGSARKFNLAVSLFAKV